MYKSIVLSIVLIVNLCYADDINPGRYLIQEFDGIIKDGTGDIIGNCVKVGDKTLVFNKCGNQIGYIDQTGTYVSGQKVFEYKNLFALFALDKSSCRSLPK